MEHRLTCIKPAGLKAEHIVPRSPSPIPLEECDRNTLSRDELLELVRRNDVSDARLSIDARD